MSALALLIVAMLAYGLFATLRRSTRIDEAKAQQITDAKMHEAAETIDRMAAEDPRAM